MQKSQKSQKLQTTLKQILQINSWSQNDYFLNE